MKLVCPECRGDLGLLDAESAQCSVHGGKFRVLFHRDTGAAPVEFSPDSSIVGGAALENACAWHPGVAATTACAECGSLMCGTCACQKPDGTWVCPTCFTQLRDFHRSAGAVARPLGDCALHPGQPAFVRCNACGAAMCQTCNFTLPGNQHACPKCVGAASSRGLSPKRKKMVIGSFVLGVWSVLAFGAFIIFSAQGRHNEIELQGIGIAMMFFVLGPAIAGAALGFGALDKRRGNSVIIWVAAIGNLLAVIGFLLLSIVGSFS